MVTIRGGLLFEGGDYLRAATIQGDYLRGLQFEGSDYLRAATIQGDY